MQNLSAVRPVALALTCTLAMACNDATFEGQIAPRAYAEQIAEEGLTAASFADGWALRFDKLLVSIGDLRVRSGGDTVASSTYRIVDLARPSDGRGQDLPAFDAPDRAYDHFGYTIGPARSAEPWNTSAMDAMAMTASGSSIWIQATATKGAQTRRLDLQFDMNLVHDCTIAGKVAADALEVRATLHVDHVLLDNTPESRLRLQ